MGALAVGIIAGAALAGPARAYDDPLPTGDWSYHCIDARMSGSELRAYCARTDGRRDYVAADIGACGGVVGYDPGQRRFYCGHRSGIVYGNTVGYGPTVVYGTPVTTYRTPVTTYYYSAPAAAVYVAPVTTYSPPVSSAYVAPVVYTVPVVAYSPAVALPAGQWRARCSDAVMVGDVLRASCERSDGTYRATEIRIGECANREILYSIRDGRFYCGGVSLASSGHFPGGGWKESCGNASMNGWVLRAQCQTRGEQILTSQIDTSQCPLGVWNDNGTLRCQ